MNGMEIEKLIAIFAAAIAHMEGAAPFRVVSFKRSGRNAPAWNIRGRDEYLSGKL